MKLQKRTAAVDDQGEEEVIAEAPDHDQSVNINEQPPEMEYMGGDDQQDE
jgi:hypothetical protein